MHENPISEAQVLRALRRSQLSFFTERIFAELEPGRPYLHNWHLDHVAWQLMRVARGEIRRLIITMPPRSMKSISASIAFPASCSAMIRESASSVSAMPTALPASSASIPAS